MNKLSDELANAWVSKTHIDLNNFDKNEIPSSREEAYEALNLFYKKIEQKKGAAQRRPPTFFYNY